MVSVGRRIGLSLACIALVAVGILAVASRAAAQDGGSVIVKVTPPKSASLDDKAVTVLVDIEGVKNLGGFQFVLTVDPRVLKPISVVKADFLGSSGREVLCLDPTIDSESILLKCVTLRDSPAGADGAGTLATITLEPQGPGESTLVLSHVNVLEPDGTELDSTTQNASLTVSGKDDGMLGTWLIIGGVVIALAAAAGAGFMLVRKRIQKGTPAST